MEILIQKVITHIQVVYTFISEACRSDVDHPDNLPHVIFWDIDENWDIPPPDCTGIVCQSCPDGSYPAAPQGSCCGFVEQCPFETTMAPIFCDNEIYCPSETFCGYQPGGGTCLPCPQSMAICYELQLPGLGQWTCEANCFGTSNYCAFDFRGWGVQSNRDPPFVKKCEGFF